MKPATDYLEPETVSEAVALLAAGDVCLRAGGQGLSERQEPRIATLSRIPELHGLFRDEGGTLRLGSMMPIRVLATSRLIGTCFPALARAFAATSPISLERGTLGGAIIGGSALAPFLPALMTLHANLRLVSEQGAREVPLGSWLDPYHRSGRRLDEVLVEVAIPCVPKRFYQTTESVRAGNELSPPILTLSSSFLLADTEADSVPRCVMAKIVIGGLAPRLVWAEATERELTGQPMTNDALAACTEALIEACPDDMPHPWSYRHRVAALRALFRRGLNEILRGDAPMVGVPVDPSWPERERHS